MSARIPYFDFYPADFMHGVRGFSAQDVGVYMMMLCRIYENNGPVEYNALRLSTYCGMRQATFEVVVQKLIDLGKLTLSNDMISNPRAESEIASRSHRLKLNKLAGKASAEKRQINQQKISTNVQPACNHTDTDTDTDIKKEKKEPRERVGVSDLQAFKTELSDLDTERLEAIIKHRKAKRGQITGHSARLFKADAAACGLSIAEAVDTCISRNWITVKADWLKPKGGNASTQTAKKPVTFATMWLYDDDGNLIDDKSSNAKIINSEPVRFGGGDEEPFLTALQKFRIADGG